MFEELDKPAMPPPRRDSIMVDNRIRFAYDTAIGEVFVGDDGGRWVIKVDQGVRHWHPLGPWRPAPVAKTSNPKHAAGLAKPAIHLAPSSAIILMAMVFELGARKYGPFNWRETAVVRSIYLDAAQRHLLALQDGQDMDEESGLPHEAHIMCCMAIVIDARELGKLIDDRGPAGTAAELLKRHTKKPA